MAISRLVSPKTPTRRRCRQCGALESVDAFPLHKGMRLGRENRCRECASDYKRSWYRRRHGGYPPCPRCSKRHTVRFVVERLKAGNGRQLGLRQYFICVECHREWEPGSTKTRHTPA